jgi:putative ATP-dependent endonuclease of OLD family
MKVEHVRVERLRSVLRAELRDIGNFNVAIGKNNSGKSTLLSAIQTFFACLSDGQVVALGPKLGKTIDFTGRDTTLPIEIELQFSISLAERDGLLRSIALEAPQLKNAVDGLDPNLLLSATLCIVGDPNRFAYVSKLALVGVGAEQVILMVSSASASELHAKMSNFQRAKVDSEQIAAAARRVDQDDWKRLREGSSPRIPRSYLIRQMSGDEPSSTVAQLIESLLNENASFADFKRAVESSGERRLDEAESHLSAPLKNPLDTFSGQETEVPKYVLNCLRLIANTRILYLSERRKPLGQEEAQRLLALKVRRGGNEALKNIQETVHALLGVHIDAFESASSGTDKKAEMDVDEFLLEVNGAGVREALRLILDFEFQQPSILLVEEPEVHLHPALEIAMMRFLKQISASCQVFVSTHSTNFLDAGDLRNVYLVSKEKHTNVQLLDLEEAQSKIPKELGLRLSTLFMFDRLLFVEGPSDEATVRELANKVGVNLAQRNVGFIRMGGVRNFTHYANEAILSFLSKRQVEIFFLLDHDEKDNQEVETIKTRLGDKATVKILSKREIENYLLKPKAIAAFIGSKTRSAGKTGTALSPERISELLSACADELKEFTIGKHVVKFLCKPVFVTDSWIGEISKVGTKGAIQAELDKQINSVIERKNSAEEVYDRESAALAQRWDSEKLNLVPGTELLDKVFQNYGVRFKKETDSSKIAVEMGTEEIDPELVDFIKCVAR